MVAEAGTAGGAMTAAVVAATVTMAVNVAAALTGCSDDGLEKSAKESEPIVPRQH